MGDLLLSTEHQDRVHDLPTRMLLRPTTRGCAVGAGNNGSTTTHSPSDRSDGYRCSRVIHHALAQTTIKINEPRQPTSQTRSEAARVKNEKDESAHKQNQLTMLFP